MRHHHHDQHDHHHDPREALGPDRGSDGPTGGRSRRFRPGFPGGFGGPGPGFGFGFGPGGPGGRRGGPRARRGDVRSAVLGLLADAPSNGYGLIKAIAERTDGAWTPSPGSVYPTLAQLVDEGLVVQPDGARGAYELTDAGRSHVDAHRAEIDAAFAAATGEGPGGEGAEELVGAFRKLVMAAHPFRADVTPAQRAAAVTALDTARRELHRILAE